MMLEIKIVADGPFYFKGSFTYIDEQMTCRHMAGESLVFCRCGRTNRAPFCDQSHNSFSLILMINLSENTRSVGNLQTKRVVK